MNKRHKRMFFVVLSIFAFIGVVATKIYYLVSKLKKDADFFFFKSNDRLDYSNEEFEDTSVGCIYSSLEIDLSESLPIKDPMHLSIKSHYSTVEVIVPDDWNVRLQGSQQKGYIDNRIEFNQDDFDSPLLFIQYETKASLLEVKKSGEVEDFFVDETNNELADETSS